MEPYIELTGINFDVEARAFDGVVVIDFWAEWCTPCKAIAPIFKDMALTHKDNPKVKFAKLDTDHEHNRELSMEYSILSIPTVKFMIKGVVVEELNGFLGAATRDELERKLKDSLAKLTEAK